jgi:hypothetical protein
MKVLLLKLLLCLCQVFDGLIGLASFTFLKLGLSLKVARLISAARMGDNL